jgi:hypothetical protein
MPESSVNAQLSPTEWKLVEALRALPQGDLQGRVPDLLTELLFYIRNARCQGMGAEGFACGDPRSTCDECQRVWDLLDTLSSRVKAG